MLKQNYTCYLLKSVAWGTHPAIGNVDQLQWAANRTLAEQNLRRVCFLNTLVGISDMVIRIIICYLLTSVALRVSPTYRQCRPAPVSGKQDSGRAGPEKSVLHKHIWRIIWYAPNYNMLSIKLCSCVGHIYLKAEYTSFLLNIAAVYISPTYRQCRPDPVSSQQESGRAGPERSVLFNT